MAINIRNVGEVADGSVTAEKLADGAVNLDTAKVTGQLPSGKLADGAVIEAKLDNLAVSTGKLKDGVVSLAKASNDLRLSHFTGDETEVTVVGDSEVEIKTVQFPKVGGVYAPTDMKFIAALKSGNALHTTSIKLYIDDEVSPRITLSSTETADYELLSGTADISDLNNGKHYIRIKMNSSDASGIAYNELIDVMLVK